MQGGDDDDDDDLDECLSQISRDVSPQGQAVAWLHFWEGEEGGVTAGESIHIHASGHATTLSLSHLSSRKHTHPGLRAYIHARTHTHTRMSLRTNVLTGKGASRQRKHGEVIQHHGQRQSAILGEIQQAY